MASSGMLGDGNGKNGWQQEQKELEPVPKWARSETSVVIGSRQQSLSWLQPQKLRPAQQQQQTTVFR